MRTRKKGFTILEVVVSLVLLAIGFQGFISLAYWGKFLFKQTDTYSKVMSVGLLKMEETLAKSYYDLTTNSSGVYNGIYWNINISDKKEGVIPYKLIEVKTANGDSSNPKRIEGRLENVVPYPYIHSFSQTIVDDGLTFVPAGAPLSSPAASSFSSIGGQRLFLSVNFEVPKNIMILYNISVEQEDIAGVLANDTIYTECFIDNIPKPVMTRTPIWTQPLISNVLGIDSILPGRHTIEVRWCKDTTSGILKLRDANLIVLAFEKNK
ncbi:MAG: prepilin-type N-terminal cleavage/methylation domain-containing protein [Candidatus Omnitrophica bacterium]|jgi:prepilin-type N-terminal cleavage/methylation domain-containing protein|nr:prepilin-type N-terminal cleavage/methylation domain-containing protein [Candidatus Omnitrophota bacterium]MDD5080014.1 prepilin-type N-terminal cleavage/methylation domain-containing protein [Candidatus Omnitrophota bacterium]